MQRITLITSLKHQPASRELARGVKEGRRDRDGDFVRVE
jgi:hypothetical protein